MAKKAAVKREIESELRKYELMLMLSPELRESEVKKKLKEIEEMAKGAGGKIVSEDFWGKRKLAYRIKKHNEAVYMVYNMELPNVFIKELKAHLRIEKEVIRSMLISLSEDYVYTKYDLDAEPEREKPKSSRRPALKKNVSIKHSSADKPKEEAKDKDKGKAANEKELDQKLDQIIGGDDLNL